MTLTRRSFLKQSSIIAAAGLGAPAYLNAATSAVSASDKINVALIGCKNMGWTNLVDFLLHDHVQCVALCDIDKSILDTKAKELSGMQKAKFDLYSDYQKVLDRKDIDAVIIGTPDHWHCQIGRASCRERV